MAEDISKRIRDFRARRGVSYAWLAKRASAHPSQLSRIINGQAPKRRRRGDVQERLISAIEKYDEHRSTALAKNYTEADQPALAVENLIKLKLKADLTNSPISSVGHLIQAKSKYSSRINTIAAITGYQNIQSFDLLEGYDKLCKDLPNLVKMASQCHSSNEIQDAAKVVRNFTEKDGRLRVSCAILPGPIATMYALKEKYNINIDVEIRHASGVELMREVAKLDAPPYDFFVVATGAFNLTLVNIYGIHTYRPILPVCYEAQENFYRSFGSKRPDPRIKSIVTYRGSSGLEELLLRTQEFGSPKNQTEDQFKTLVELFPTIDTGQVVNVWDPLSTVLRGRFGLEKAATAPYSSLICLYQHKKFSHRSLHNVSLAFQRLFVHQWNRLANNRAEALGYLYGNEALNFQFWLGAGLNVKA